MDLEARRTWHGTRQARDLGPLAQHALRHAVPPAARAAPAADGTGPCGPVDERPSVGDECHRAAWVEEHLDTTRVRTGEHGRRRHRIHAPIHVGRAQARAIACRAGGAAHGRDVVVAGRRAIRPAAPTRGEQRRPDARGYRHEQAAPSDDLSCSTVALAIENQHPPNSVIRNAREGRLRSSASDHCVFEPGNQAALYAARLSRPQVRLDAGAVLGRERHVTPRYALSAPRGRAQRPLAHDRRERDAHLHLSEGRA